jgi:hypothetical protein
MNLEQQLKLQAWVDGELPDSEGQRLTEVVASDEAARALVGELRIAKSILAGNEPEARLSDSREFYWSKIARAIERADKVEAQVPRVSWALAWRRLLAPLSGVALVAFLTVVSLNLFQRGEIDDGRNYLVEVENLSEDIGSISYKSQSENMFVVYLYNKEQDVERGAELEPIVDLFFQ